MHFYKTTSPPVILFCFILENLKVTVDNDALRIIHDYWKPTNHQMISKLIKCWFYASFN